LYELDMENMKWQEVKSLKSNDEIMTATGKQTIVSDGGRVYWYGGSEETFGYTCPVNRLQQFNPYGKVWNVVKTSKVAVDPPRVEHPSLEYCDMTEPLDADDSYQGGPCLFAFGGLSVRSNYVDKFHRYDIRSKSWRKINTTTQPSSRSNSTLVHLRSQQKLLLYGGRGSGGTLDDIWTFDLSKQRQSWQEVRATGKAPSCSRESQQPIVALIKGSEPKIVVLKQSDTAEVIFYFLDCSTLHWTVLNSHIQMELGFASLFQPNTSNGNQFLLYLASLQKEEHIYSVSITHSSMPAKLYETLQQRHLLDVTIAFNQ